MAFSTTVRDSMLAVWHETQQKLSLRALLNSLKSYVGQSKVAVVAGGAAGNFTVTGIAVADELISVLYFAGAGTDITDVSDLTSEFSITAVDTINNTGGTASTGGKLVVLYRDLS